MTATLRWAFEREHVLQVFKARWILPIEMPPIENGAIAVEHGRIVGVASAGDLPDADVTDYGDAIITPGFVNPHTHLELTAYQGAVPRGPLWDWFKNLIELLRRPAAADVEKAGIYKGAVLSLQAGVTCVGDISRTGIHVAELAAWPLRKVCYVELISGAVHPPNDSVSLRQMIEQLLPQKRENRLIIGVSPHTPYTVLQEELAGCAELAESSDLPLTMHVLETPEEAAWLLGQGEWLSAYLAECDLPTARERQEGGAFDRMEKAGLLRRPVLLAHMNYASEEDVKRLASTGASVVWCPRSHAFFGHAEHPWREMLKLGVNVCVGTDSLASNDSLSILDELRFIHKATPDFAVDSLLALGTIRGAKSLGLADRIGSLAPGKLADFAVFPIESREAAEPRLNLLEGTASPIEVRIDGACIWQAS